MTKSKCANKSLIEKLIELMREALNFWEVGERIHDGTAEEMIYHVDIAEQAVGESPERCEGCEQL